MADLEDINELDSLLDYEEPTEEVKDPVELETPTPTEPPVEETPKEVVTEPETPETPPTEEPEATPEEPAAPAPLTRDDIRSVISELRNEERTESKQYETTYNEIKERYYPDGLSKVMLDVETGKPIRTAQDVIDLSGNPDLTIEQAEQWRLQKQAEWDAQYRDIEDSISKVADQTISLDRGLVAVQEKYGDLFKAYPQLEQKALSMFMNRVSIDPKTKAVLSAPDDPEVFFDNYLEYPMMAFQAASQAPTATPVAPTPVPQPTKDDRLDVSGDGGGGGDDDIDPNDFEAQLRKEFSDE